MYVFIKCFRESSLLHFEYKFQICMMLQDGKGSSSIDEDGNAYAVFGDQWVSYDSPITVVEKVKNYQP